MESRSMNVNNSTLIGNFIQGDINNGSVKASIKAELGSQENSTSFKNDLRGANIANFANQVSDNARQQTNQHIYGSEQERTLEEAAKEIQQLLKQLEVLNPNASEDEKVAFINYETAPSFKHRVVGALQAGGEAAIEQFLDNPYVNVVKAVVKGWIEPD